ncbi:MAG: CBS domain-containing protein [Ignavibacteriaceae bacterium]|nr:CBS domain-containing protein [Ignavibacteriaceae bacterium]
MMRVKELLKSKGRDVYSITPDATVYDALKLMAEKEIGAVVGLDGEKMVGILSERDYARKVILSGKSSEETLVREIMTSDVMYVGPGEKVKHCLSIMTKKHFRHLPVLEEDKVIGVLSIGDVKSKL